MKLELLTSLVPLLPMKSIVDAQSLVGLQPQHDLTSGTYH